jgi:lysophospholipase L1-like esterase
MAGSATITGTQHYVQGIGHPKADNTAESAPVSLATDSNGNPIGIVNPKTGLASKANQLGLTDNASKVPSIVRGILTAYRATATTVSNYELDALREPLERLVRSSAWAKLKELWIPCGTTAADAYVKLKWDATAGQAMTTAAAPTYTQATGMLGNGTTSLLLTGLNPTTAGFTAGDWGFGVYSLITEGLSSTGVLGGYTTSTNTYLSVNSGGSSINGSIVGIDLPYTRFNAVQIGGGNAQQWYGGYQRASVASVGALAGGPISLLSVNGAFNSNANIGGYAAWTPSLTQAEMQALAAFFDSVNQNLWRASWGSSLIACGDSNTIGTGTGVTNLNRFSYLVAKALGLANVAGAEFNGGHNGSTMSSGTASGNLDWYTSYQLSEVYKCKPPLTLMMIGTNDAGWAVPISTFQAQYDNWLSNQIAAGIDPSTIILISPIAGSNINGSYVVTNTTLPNYVAVVKALALKYGTGYYDAYALTLSHTGNTDWYQTDFIHLNATGHAALATALLAYIGTTYARQPLMTNAVL